MSFRRRWRQAERADCSEPTRKPEDVFDLAKLAYTEVLDATKHQDDKIGRFLTAIAFLTTGAIALLFGGSVAGQHFQLDHSDGQIWSWMQDDYPLLAWSAWAFFVCILGSVTLLLLTLTVPLRLPGTPSLGPNLVGSRLFFTHIADEPRWRWAAKWQIDPSDVRREVITQLVSETHNLAERARAKYTHTNEAAQLFVLSLLFLASSIVLVLSARTQDALKPGVTPIVDVWSALALFTVSTLHATIQVYALYVQSRDLVDARAWDRGSPTADPANGDEKAALRIKWLFVAIPLFVGGVMLPVDQPQRVMGAVAAGCAALLAAIATQPDRSRGHESRRWRSVRHVLVFTVVGTALLTCALWAGGIFQLGIGLVPSIWLSSSALRSSHLRRQRTWERRAEEVRSRGARPT